MHRAPGGIGVASTPPQQGIVRDFSMLRAYPLGIKGSNGAAQQQGVAHAGTGASPPE